MLLVCFNVCRSFKNKNYVRSLRVPASLHGGAKQRSKMEEVSVALREYQQLSLVSPTWSVCVRAR